MKQKVKVPKANKGYGYVGVWQNGTVGWFMPQFICGPSSRKYPDVPNLDRPELKNERLFLCEITVKPLIDKKGRPITKIVK